VWKRLRTGSYPSDCGHPGQFLAFHVHFVVRDGAPPDDVQVASAREWPGAASPPKCGCHQHQGAQPPGKKAQHGSQGQDFIKLETLSLSQSFLRLAEAQPFLLRAPCVTEAMGDAVEAPSAAYRDERPRCRSVPFSRLVWVLGDLAS
jgi:hypothetical protein